MYLTLFDPAISILCQLLYQYLFLIKQSLPCFEYHQPMVVLSTSFPPHIVLGTQTLKLRSTCLAQLVDRRISIRNPIVY